MSLHGCLRCLKFVVFSLNFVLCVAGMAVLGLAIYLRMDPRVNHYVRSAYSNESNEPSLFYIVCYILIGTGVAVTYVAFLGCCGAFQESRCMLGSFFVFMILVFIAEITGGVFAFIHRQKLEAATTTFQRLVHDEYFRDPNHSTLLEQSLDFVQRSLECCGGKEPYDWSTSQWERSNIHHLTQVPDSCCIAERVPKGFSEGPCGVSGAWIDGKHEGVWPQGCGAKLQQVVQDKLMLMLAMGLGVAGVELLSLIFSLILCCGMRRAAAGGYKR